MTARADTFERSCEHWSDAGRDEMETFYELARVDYRYLAQAYDGPTHCNLWVAVTAGSA